MIDQEIDLRKSNILTKKDLVSATSLNALVFKNLKYFPTENFLFNRAKENNGIVQKFEEPMSPYNSASLCLCNILRSFHDRIMSSHSLGSCVLDTAQATASATGKQERAERQASRHERASGHL